MLQAKASEVEGRAEQLGDDRVHQDIQEDCDEVMLFGALVRPVAQRARPAGDQKDDQEKEADDGVTEAQPAL